ncbi:hypothetical protein [Kitasatospora sp. SUK 42]|uniref:hypothetical protein n=1 Tax=Kitasatospora sp. SUK 42 TaxID=1588882 RepID=UPI0018CB5311|nr:hypothetical protein [Kitasatospora sp. SUK 42]MBV2153361.1 hypothetical protein [Kitasatospora sp. SUK 42]
MTGPFECGAMLVRLLDHRGLGVPELADRAGVMAPDLRAVLAGASPDAELLRWLATALGLHAVDLFVLAGVPVPDDLLPWDAAAARWASDIVQDGVHLPAAGRQVLLEVIRSLPREERDPDPEPAQVRPLSDGPGGRVIGMTRCRNLRLPGLAQALAVVTPSCLAASTYGRIGDGGKDLTPRLVMDFAALLGIDALDLSALTGVALPEPPPPAAPEAVDAAALLWEARRLSAAQAKLVAELARAMRPAPRNCYQLNLSGSDAFRPLIHTQASAV